MNIAFFYKKQIMVKIKKSILSISEIWKACPVLILAIKDINGNTSFFNINFVMTQY